MQEDVALFATSLIRLKAQIICTKFQPETILKYAAADQMQPVDQQMIPQALELIKSDPLRSFRIEVAADSLIQLDEQQTQEMMDLGQCGDRTLASATAGALFYGHRRWDAIDRIDVGS